MKQNGSADRAIQQSERAPHGTRGKSRPPAFSVRFARPSDARALFALNRAFNGADTADTDAIAAALYKTEAAAQCTPGVETVWLAETDAGEPAGFVCAQTERSFCYKTPSARITEMYVDARFRREGVGGALIETAVKALREAGIDEITLLTGGDNAPARAFYEKHGFRLSGEAHYETPPTREGE